MSGIVEKSNGVARTCVVVSYWTGLPIRSLHKLLRQMRTIDAGSPFDLVVVCNGGNQRPLALPRRFDDLRPRILNRENDNYNLGAWDHGWRNAPGHEYYLFLQDDCYIKDADWVYGFERRMDLDPGVGLLGEVERGVGMSWEYVDKLAEQADPDESPDAPDSPRRFYSHLFSTLKARSVPLGATFHHIPSIILFARRAILEQVDGFHYFGPSKEDAIAAEVALSREIIARGHNIARVANVNFQFVGHSQWDASGYGHYRELTWRSTVRRALQTLEHEVKTRLGIRRRSQKHGRARPFPPPCEPRS